MIENGSTVTIHYTLKVDDEVVDTSAGKEPFTYTQGAGQVIPGLETALEGLKAGQKKTVLIPPEEAYGPHNPEAVYELPKDAFQDVEQLKVGDTVRGRFENQSFQATVSAIGEGTITLDLNHPLAGKTLCFEVEVLEIN